MGELMRSHDWSATSLGPIDRWPQSLRTAVRLILNTGHPMYIWWGSQHVCLYNDAYSASIGADRHPSSLGRPAREVWDEIWNIISPQIEQVMSGRGATWNVDHLVPITRNGIREDVYWTYSYSPIDDATAPGGIGGVLVVCSETTRQVLAARQLAIERDLAATALREGEARFRAALKAGRMGSWETDLTTMIRTWSPEGMNLFGLNLPGGCGQVGGDGDEYLNAIHPDDRHVVQQFRELADQQDSFSAEYRIVKPDGGTLWLVGGGLVTKRDAKGAALRLVSIMADATERKLAEEKLRMERERLSLALRAGQMGAYELDIKKDELWWSPEMFALFGVDPREFVPTPQNVLALLSPEAREEFTKLRSEAIELRRPFLHQFHIRRGDASEVWLGHRGQIEYDAHGEPVRSFGITMDISERKKVEEVLLDADRQKDTFIAVLAHELRNPLAPIRNALGVLKLKGAADEKASWCIAVIDRQTALMSRLLDDLLDISRLNHGQLRLRKQPMDLAAAIEQAIEAAQPLFDARRHTFSASLPAQPLLLEGDPTRLAQVFSNVLINAAKYTPPGGKIGLAFERQNDVAVVRVTDTGIGIAAQDLARIFDTFGQVESDEDHSQGGQGIGLSLAKELLEMHGGSIEVRSAGPGQGSDFEVRLPLATRALGDPADVPPVSGDESKALRSTGYRILIADDLKDSGDSLAKVLEMEGHVVSVAYDGAQALQRAEAFAPQIVLLDLGMPKLDGYEVCRRIRAASWGAGILLVAQTGWGGEQDRRRTRDAGFDHHLVKPVHLAALLKLIEGFR